MSAGNDLPMNTRKNSNKSASKQTYEGIQVLRVVAALLVVITHTTFYTHERLSADMPIWRTGAMGVDIFFIISGFVMMATAGSLINTPGGWKIFASKRLIRIAPMYWLATSVKLISMLIIPSMVLHAELSPWTIISSYAFLPSTNIEGRFEPLLGVGWTLIFEMFFYAVFTVGLFLRVNVIAFTTMVMGTCFIISLFRTPEWNAATMYFSPIVLYFLIGMILFKLSKQLRPSAMIAIALIGIAICAIAFATLEFDVKSGAANFATVAISCLIVLVTIAIEPFVKGRLPAALLFFGEASYVLYLFHPLIAPIVPEVLRRTYPAIPPGACVAICVAVSLIAAAIIHVAIEKPVTARLRNLKIHNSSSPQAATS